MRENDQFAVSYEICQQNKIRLTTLTAQDHRFYQGRKREDTKRTQYKQKQGIDVNRGYGRFQV